MKFRSLLASMAVLALGNGSVVGVAPRQRIGFRASPVRRQGPYGGGGTKLARMAAEGRIGIRKGW